MDVKSKIFELLPEEATVTNSATATFSMTFFLSYDATDNVYIGEWRYKDETVRYEYNPGGYKYYRDFVMECASFPLEKVSFYLFSKGEFPEVFRLTYHPALDEYSDFSSEYFVFSSERLSGNRNLFLIDRKMEIFFPCLCTVAASTFRGYPWIKSTCSFRVHSMETGAYTTCRSQKIIPRR